MSHNSSDQPRQHDGNRRSSNHRQRRSRNRNHQAGGGGRDREHRGPRRENSDYEFIPGRELRAEAKSERPRKGGPPSKAPGKMSLGRKILSILTFGLMGKEKTLSGAGKRPHQPPPMRTTVSKSSKPANPGQRSAGSHPPASGARSGDQPRRERPPQSADKSFKPVDLQSITTAKLHVGNLSYDASEGDLFELFNGVGKVSNAEIVTHPKTQKSKGFGFVTMSSVEEAKRAVEELHGKPFMGRAMTVGPARGDGPRVKLDRSEGSASSRAEDVSASKVAESDQGEDDYTVARS